MTDEERHDVDYVKSMLETAAYLIEQLAHELLATNKRQVATNKRLVQLEARVKPLAKHPRRP